MTRITTRRIVVGVDGTAASTAAVRWAVREARLRHATIDLVSVCYYDPRLHAHYVPLAQTPDRDEREAAARACLATAADLARRHLPPARLMAELADGLPARALLDRAAGAQMLVLGTSRPAPQSTGHSRDAIGAVARVCLSKAPCPVVIVAPALYEDPHAGRPHSASRQHAPVMVGPALGQERSRNLRPARWQVAGAHEVAQSTPSVTAPSRSGCSETAPQSM